MNGRHVLAPQGARAIQNPAYRPAGKFFSRDIEEKSLEISRLRPRARLVIQGLFNDPQASLDRRLLEIGAIKSYRGSANISGAIMGQVDKRSITLSPELAQAVDDVVAAGEY